MEATMKFLVTIQQGEDGMIVAECPALPGCASQGRTREEVMRNIREAIELSVETREAKKGATP
jgi:predicted RNase H-like HicB family nuclease